MDAEIIKKRIEYYDFLRGIAIIMVVGIHTFVSYPMDTTIGYASAFVRQILNCAVPIFLALSGLFCGRKLLDNKQTRMSFWKKQIPKVYIPALIWSLPYFALNVINLNGGGYFVVKQMIMFLTCGFSIYYFIALIIQFYILLPVLQKYKYIMMPTSIIVSISTIVLITWLTKMQGLQIPMIMFAGPFVTWFVFFMLGVYYSSSKINYTVKQTIAVIVFGFVLECIETYWLNTNYGGGYGIKLSAFIYSAGVVMLILSPKVKAAYKSSKLTSIIAYIGNISFGVYLIHCFVIKGVNYLLPIHNWALSWLLVVIITSIVIIAARKILPHGLNKYLGFS